jgi:hypothetical protein
MTDLVVSEGYAAVGYEYINIDDCWLEKERSYSGQLVPDRQRFPYGLQDLSDYVSYVMLRHVALVRTDVSEEHSASIIRVTRMGEL